MSEGLSHYNPFEANPQPTPSPSAPDSGLSLLQNIYGPEALYVSHFEGGVGYLQVTDEHVAEGHNTPDLTSTDEAGMGILEVTQAHVRGHFQPDIVSVFPGHRNLRAAGTTLRQMHRGDRDGEMRRASIGGFDHVSFLAPVFPGEEVSYKLSDVSKSDHAAFAEVHAQKGTRSVMKVDELSIDGWYSRDAMREDQLVEAAAQTLGLAAFTQLDSEPGYDGKPKYLPLFEEIGQTDFMNVNATEDHLIRAGETILFRANLITATEKAIHGEVSLYREGEGRPAVVFHDLKARLLPYQTAMRLLRPR